MTRVYLFKRFERFWHWAQAALVLFMLVTGFEVHGTYRLFGWEKAGNLHTIAAWTLIGLWLFAIFWHFTTGEWKQYIPTTRNMLAVARYYSVGIFTGEPHPHRVTQLAKHNPLQRVTYLIIKLLINPLLWASGLAVSLLRRVDPQRNAATAAAAHRAGAYGGRLHDADLRHLAHLPVDHRPHAAGAHQGDDHRLGEGRHA